ncbi:MAG: CopG family transcriptional regulator [Candidatus Aminicenantaceae bacterium]
MSVKPKSRDKVTIKIPRVLYTQLSQIVADSGFNSVTDFIIYVLRDLVSSSRDKSAVPPEGSLNKEEIEAIRKRLKSLGYL